MNLNEDKKSSLKRGSLESLLHSTHTVTIEKMAIGGKGIGRLLLSDGHKLVVFVDQAAPNDVVKIEITKVSKTFTEARILEILTPSPARRMAPCKYAFECGGCSWQHFSEAEQIKQKELILKDLFKQFIPDVKFDLLPTVTSGHLFEYRNRIQLKQIGPALGYFKRNSHDLVEIDNCLIAEKPLQTEIARLKQAITQPTKTQTKAAKKSPFKQIDHARTRPEKAIEKITNSSVTPPAKAYTSTTMAAQSVYLSGSEVERTVKKYELYLDEETGLAQTKNIGEKGEGLAFSQVNRFINEQLIETVLNITEKVSPTFVSELYAGAGNFSFPITKQLISKNPAFRMECVELNDQLTRIFTEQIKSQKYIKNMAIFTTTSENFCGIRPLSQELVLLDPPRAGCDKAVMYSISAARPQHILYISCHPVQLARDLQILFKNNPQYRIEKLQIFDMFPQTDHFETLCWISK